MKNIFEESEMWFELGCQYYAPREQVNGFLFLKLKETIPEATIFVNLIGTSEMRIQAQQNEIWQKSNLETKEKSSKAAKNKIAKWFQSLQIWKKSENLKDAELKVTKEPKLISNVTELIKIGDMKKMEVLWKGFYKIPFSLVLPKELAGSTEFRRQGKEFFSVSYKLLATVRCFEHSLQAEKEIEIQQSHFTKTDDLAIIPLSEKIECSSQCLSDRGKIYLKVKPRTTRVAVGNFVELKVDFDLEFSELDINKVIITLEKENLFKTKEGNKSRTDILKTIKKGSIPKKKNFKKSLHLLPCRVLQN